MKIYLIYYGTNLKYAANPSHNFHLVYGETYEAALKKLQNVLVSQGHNLSHLNFKNCTIE